MTGEVAALLTVVGTTVLASGVTWLTGWWRTRQEIKHEELIARQEAFWAEVERHGRTHGRWKWTTPANAAPTIHLESIMFPEGVRKTVIAVDIKKLEAACECGWATWG